MESYSAKSRRTRGVNKRDIRRIERLRGNDVSVIAEYTFDEKINEGIKKAFPLFKGVQKIYEVTDGDTCLKMMELSLMDNKFTSTGTFHTPEGFSKIRFPKGEIKSNI